MHNACSVQITACNSYSISYFTEMLKNKDYMHKDCVKPLFYHDDLFRIFLRRIKSPLSILGELDINYNKTIFSKKKLRINSHSNVNIALKIRQVIRINKL